MGDWKRMSKRGKAAVFDYYGIPHDIKPSAPRAAPVSREGPVLSACIDLLHAHPKVLFAVRQNSGAASYEHSSGRYAPLWFYKWVKVPEPVTLPDLWGMLVSGRMFFFEVKRPDWKRPSDDRERRQEAFLTTVHSRGALSQFITDTEQILKLLEGA